MIALRYGETHRRLCVTCCCVASGVAQVLMAWTGNIYVGEILMCFTGLGFMGSFMPLRGALMSLIKDPHRASVVLGITFQGFFAGMAISSMVSSGLAKHFGCPTVLTICGAGLIVTAIVMPMLPGIKKIG